MDQPEQLNSEAQLDRLYQILAKAIRSRSVQHFTYAEFADNALLVSDVDNIITFKPVVESKKIQRVGVLAGVVAAISKRNSGTRTKLHIWLANGPTLIVEQGSRFGLG